jgi:hypothetical protein
MSLLVPFSHTRQTVRLIRSTISLVSFRFLDLFHILATPVLDGSMSGLINPSPFLIDIVPFPVLTY